MPIYEFVCKKCNREFEKLVRSQDVSGVTCEFCGSAEVTRKLSVFAAAVKSPASSCANADSCPSAAAGTCGCGGCCGHHHH